MMANIQHGEKQNKDSPLEINHLNGFAQCNACGCNLEEYFNPYYGTFPKAKYCPECGQRFKTKDD